MQHSFRMGARPDHDTTRFIATSMRCRRRRREWRQTLSGAPKRRCLLWLSLHPLPRSQQSQPMDTYQLYRCRRPQSSSELCATVQLVVLSMPVCV